MAVRTRHCTLEGSCNITTWGRRGIIGRPTLTSCRTQSVYLTTAKGGKSPESTKLPAREPGLWCGPNFYSLIRGVKRSKLHLTFPFLIVKLHALLIYIFSRDICGISCSPCSRNLERISTETALNRIMISISIRTLLTGPVL
jgi:hypothetical protein